MDTSDQTLPVRVQRTKKRRRTIQERREIVEETLLPGASVSRVARRHDINANQVFYWRKLHREGRLGSRVDAQLEEQCYILSAIICAHNLKRS